MADKDKRHVMLEGGGDVHEISNDKPLISESKAVILAVFCSFLICMILFLVLWFGRDLEYCANSFTVVTQGSVSLINQPYYAITVRGSNTPLRFALQGLGHQISISYSMCRIYDDGSTQCVNNTQSGALITDTYVNLYDPEPCHEDNSTGLWLQIYNVTPSPVVLMYCFASDNAYAMACLQQATAPPMPTRTATPASEAAVPSSVPFTGTTASGSRRSVDSAQNSENTETIENIEKEQQRFMFFSTAFSAKPDWYLFTATYAWDPVDGLLPQYLPPYPQIGYCAQTENFRLLDLSYRACYNDQTTIPVTTKCTSWVDLQQQYYFNDTLLFMPTAKIGNIVVQIQAADGPFIAAVGVKPDIDTICGSDGSFNLWPPQPGPPAPASPPPPTIPAPAPKKAPTTGH